MTAVWHFILCAVVILVAATILTRCADAIAQTTKLGRLLVGSLFLAGATSLPELAIDINAVRMGLADVAVGDLVGSSLFNLLILAVFDLTHHSRRRMLSRMSSAHALSGAASIGLTALAGATIYIGGRRPDWALGGISVGSLVIFGAYLLSMRVIFYDQRVSRFVAQEKTVEAAVPRAAMSLRTAIIGFIVSAIAVLITGPFMAKAAGEIAATSGLGNTFVGTTLVACTTSFAELVTTATAVRMGAMDLAIGNIYGSNAFNMVLLLPLDLASPAPLVASVSSTHVVTCFAVILVTSIALLGQLYSIEKRIAVVEPDAVLVIVLVIACLGVIYALR